jgi:hypothetical protein
MEVKIREIHFSSTRDVEGGESFVWGRMDDESEEFKKLMDDFHVLEKYQSGNACDSRTTINNDGTGNEVYFSGWVQDFGEHPHKEMCYIFITKPKK